MHSSITSYPRAGTDDDLFCRLAEYITMFNKGWINKIKPASKEQIFELKKVLRLEEIYKQELPKSYEIFLSTMGNNDGGLLSGSYVGSTDIESIIELNRDFHEFPEPNEGACFPFIAGTVQQYAFDFNGKHLENVVMTDCAKVVCVKSENFEKFLFQSAYFQFERYTFHRLFVATSNNIKTKTQRADLGDVFEVVLAVAGNVTEKHGLKKVWFSDFNNYIALGDGISFRIQRVDKKGAAYGSVSGNNQETVEDILNILVDILGFENR